MADDVTTLDTSDVDRHVGEEVGGGQLKEPVTVGDIRRWVQAMNYPNGRHYDEDAAARSPQGEIVAPQSFAVCCDCGHGAIPAIVGAIPGSHVVFGGDEFWFFGPSIRPGDHINVRRRFDGYSLADTKFAGPTMFSRGDTTYVNQRGEAVAKQRSTMVRYLAAEARARGHYERTAGEPPVWTAEHLADIDRQRAAWVASGRSGAGPETVEVGDVLPVRPVGPHTIAQFVTEWRSFIYTLWGSQRDEGDYRSNDKGFIDELLATEDDDLDPTMQKSLERGPASGHTDVKKAQLVGLPRPYGYGVSMGVWSLDLVAYWAGDRAFIRHAKMDYRSPTWEGDLAVIEGVVHEFGWDPKWGAHVARVGITMTNQDDVVLAKGFVEVELPPETRGASR